MAREGSVDVYRQLGKIIDNEIMTAMNPAALIVPP